MTLNHLQPMHHYIRLSMEPCCTDVLLMRKSLQDTLTDMFGLTFSSIYIDILSVNDQGSEVVIRVNPEDASRILAAVAASITCSVMKESSFLPSLLSSDLGAQQ
ncbi:hypothetical protein PAXRUDRAFT_825048 [Paxillus rubicundulus Ve08.2h10]|uniref:Ribonucleases P/MRP subunit Pop8-like domain-containing protein n=1 Tax=Paxillus rubicundulus Ve08.2h10 TaxID=930991 RepID=A0A0D0DTN2_9AGAM|nr:hypothetical protein PAXRUDRAFT_825048 [Paxillus rubicundulus Ve08.2h10]